MIIIVRIILKALLLALIGIFNYQISYGQLLNLHFEEIDEQGQLRSWTLNNQQQDGSKLTLDSLDKASGKYSLKLSKSGSSKNIFAVQFTAFTVEKVKKMKLRVKVKSALPQIQANLYMSFMDEAKKPIGNVMKPVLLDTMMKNEWQDISMFFVVSPDMKFMNLFLNLSGNGEINFDDLQLIEVTEAASTQIASIAQEAIEKIKKNAIVSDSVDWKDLEQKLPLNLLGLHSEEHKVEAVQFILSYLRKAGDLHSHYYTKERFDNYRHKPVQLQNANNTLNFATGKMLPSQIAYVKVPRFGSLHAESEQAYADTLNKIVLDLMKSGPKGWIVDLSENSGGNMYPMIAGLYALIGDGKVLSFENKQGSNSLYMNKGQFGRVKLSKITEQIASQKIACLMSQMTASSGEMTLISLLGKPNTKSFGYPTAGLTSANSFVELSDGSALSLAGSYVRDRTDKIYRGSIQPDVLINAKTFEEVLAQLENWILP
ncbi:S41 family peptidase [Sphingobacterium sp. HJSM2_6]|uniref:S41 family peptidase n=1 Tax=Sphingobacterium sp. HJSM2_6 TaxID=3366264 RepID=UPI003BE923F7